MGAKQRVVQVTRSNFPRALEEMRSHIDHSHYVAISTRRTGGFRRPWHRVLPIDTPNVAYLKAKAAAESYGLLQFAVCPFRFHHSTKLLAFPYNFHLFPRDELNVGMPSHGFSCQTSFLTSMAREGFDFNACVYDGISYLSRAQESKAKAWSSLPYTFQMPTSSSLSTADKIFIDRTTSKVRLWKDACKGPYNVREDALLTSLRKLIICNELHGSRPCLSIDVLSSHQAQLVVQVLTSSFSDIVHVIIPGRGRVPRVVQAILTNSEEDKTTLLKELQNQEEEHTRNFWGFRAVVDLISSSCKPVIASDCLNEFAFVYSKFLAPLPSSITEFSSSLGMAFPNVLDVNQLLKELGPSGKANLSAAISYLRRQIVVPIDMETPQDNEESCKNLGNNVLKVVEVFAKLCSVLKINPCSDDKPDIASLANYVNLLRPCPTGVGESEVDVGLWLDNTRKVSTHNLVFVWGFRKGLSTAALEALLRRAHPSFSEDFELKIIDNQCAVIVFPQTDLAESFLEDMVGGRTCPASLLNLISEGLNVACYGVYKRVCEAGLLDADLADLLDKYSQDSMHDPSGESKKELLDLCWPDDLIMSLSEI